MLTCEGWVCGWVCSRMVCVLAWRCDPWHVWLACMCAESWHVDVDPHKERKEKNTRKKILTRVWMMDVCVRASVLRVDAD